MTTIGREGKFEARKGRGKEGRKSNFHNSSRKVLDFEVNYWIRGLLSL